MKERITVLLTAVMIAVFSIAGPALAQSAAHTGVPYRGKVVAAPGGSGAPLGVETSTKKISGTAGTYVRFPARITNTTGKLVKDAVTYLSLADVTRGQQAPVDLEDWSAHRAITIRSPYPPWDRGSPETLVGVSGW